MAITEVFKDKKSFIPNTGFLEYVSPASRPQAFQELIRKAVTGDLVDIFDINDTYAVASATRLGGKIRISTAEKGVQLDPNRVETIVNSLGERIEGRYILFNSKAEIIGIASTKDTYNSTNSVIPNTIRKYSEILEDVKGLANAVKPSKQLNLHLKGGVNKLANILIEESPRVLGILLNDILYTISDTVLLHLTLSSLPDVFIERIRSSKGQFKDGTGEKLFWYYVYITNKELFDIFDKGHYNVPSLYVDTINTITRIKEENESGTRVILQ